MSNRKTLNECAEPEILEQSSPTRSPQRCDADNVNATACDGSLEGRFFDETPFQFLEQDTTARQEGLGRPRYCNPISTGSIIREKDEEMRPDRTVIHNYAKGLRAADEGMKKLFTNVVVIDNDGKVFPVPIIWGSQERAIQYAIQGNVRKDNTLVTDRLVLPIMSIYTSSYDFTRERYIYSKAVDYLRRIRSDGKPGWTDKERYNRDTVFGVTRGIPVNLGYTLTIWAKYWEDMNQILEQVATKFDPVAYISLQGITNWETIVQLNSVANNVDTEPGEGNRIIKFQIEMTLESFIPQPIVRRKAVLKTRIDVLDNIDDTEIQNIVSRIEEAVGELDI